MKTTQISAQGVAGGMGNLGSKDTNLTIRIADQDPAFKMAFNGPCNVQRFIDKVCKQHGLNRENVRVLHKGRLLNNLEDNKTMSEAKVMAGDEICILNTQKTTDRHLGQQLYLLNSMKRKGVTKVDMYSIKGARSSQILQNSATQLHPSSSSGRDPKSQVTPTKGGLLSRLMPKFLGGSPSTTNGSPQQQASLPMSAEKASKLSTIEKEMKLERLTIHLKQKDNTYAKFVAPDPEMIANATNAPKALKTDKYKNKKYTDPNLLSSHTALYELLRDAGLRDLPRPSGGQNGPSSSALSQSSQQRHDSASAFFQQLGLGRPNPVSQPSAAPEIQPDETLLKNLVELGFSEARSKRALKHFLNSFEQALDHMMNTEDSSDDRIFGLQNTTVPASMRGSVQQQPSFTPNSDALKMLLEMGYSREDSVCALRVCGNSLENACSFLINNPNPAANMFPQHQSQSVRLNVGGGNGSQPAAAQTTVNFGAQVNQQAQQRTQALFQDVTRLEAALQQLVQSSNHLNRQIDRPEAGMPSSQAPQYQVMMSDSDDSDDQEYMENDFFVQDQSASNQSQNQNSSQNQSNSNDNDPETGTDDNSNNM